MFAKLYETDKGQILCKIDTGESDKPEIRYFFEPNGLGVCSVAMTFEDDETGDAWERADKAFEDVSEQSAKGVFDRFLDMVNT